MKKQKKLEKQMISLKELRVKLSSKDGFAPKSEDEKRFRDKHKVQAHPDRNGNGDEVFKASKVKTYEREKEHGYNVDKDQDVYEDVEQATDSIRSPARIKNLAQKTIVRIQEGGMPSSVAKTKQRYADMSHKEFADLHGDKSKQKLEDMAWRHGYGKGSQFYVDKVAKGKSSTNEEVEEIDEVLKPSMGAAAYIKDFVHSDNPKFKGKSKKQRMKQALAAYYSAKRGG